MAVNKQMQFNNGEGVVHTDFNDLQGFMRAQLFDTIGQMARIGLFGQEDNYRLPYGSYAFCIGAGGAPAVGDSHFYGFASGRTIHNRAGVVFQMIGNSTDQSPGTPSGDTPEFLAYHVGEDEWVTTLAANASGNPRIDIFCIKLDQLAGDSESRDIEDAVTGVVTTQSVNKRLNVRCQTQVVQGTPAGSPVEPAVPSGYVKLWSYLCPNGFTSTITTNLADYRIPLGIKCIDISCAEVVGLDHGASDLNAYAGVWSSGVSFLGGRSVNTLASGEAWWMARPKQMGNQRLMGVQLLANSATTVNWNAELAFITDTAYTARTEPTTLTADLFPASGTVVTWRQSSLLDIPLWGNGGRNGHARDLDESSLHSQYTELVMKIRSTATGSGTTPKVRFIFAGLF